MQCSSGSFTMTMTRGIMGTVPANRSEMCVLRLNAGEGLQLQSLPFDNIAFPRIMATATKTSAAGAKKAARKTAARSAPASKSAGPGIKPVKDTFTKTALAMHLAERAAVEPKAVKAVLAALEEVILGSVHSKGVGEISLLGLVKIGVQKVEAKKRRFGKDPFTKEERWFDAKPATVRIKARALKKLRDAAA